MKTPRNTTHVRLDTDGKRSSMMTVKDMDCIAGGAGTVTFLQQLHGKDKYKELGSFAFDGGWPIKKEETNENS